MTKKKKRMSKFSSNKALLCDPKGCLYCVAKECRARSQKAKTLLKITPLSRSMVLTLEHASDSSGELVTPQFLIQLVWGGTWECASLTKSQVMTRWELLLLFYNLPAFLTSTFITRITTQIKRIKLLKINEMGGNYEEID